MASRLPLNDTIIAAMAQLIDDSKTSGEYREPSHSDLDFYFNQAGLGAHDPKRHGQVVGKAKRARAVLHAALVEDEAAGAKLVESILAKVRACGGFRAGSDNFVGAEAIANARDAFEHEGFLLADDGTIGPKVLSALKGAEMTAALRAYADRAARGSEDAALLTGTGKDLMEATAAHALTTINGGYPSSLNFQALLGMAFIALDLAVPEMPTGKDEPAAKLLERGMFHCAIAVNRLRNKQGTGHGRPWVPTASAEETKAAIEAAGSVSAYMLAKLAKKARH